MSLTILVLEALVHLCVSVTAGCTYRRILKATEGHRRLPKADVSDVESCVRYFMRNSYSTFRSGRLYRVAQLKWGQLILFLVK